MTKHLLVISALSLGSAIAFAAPAQPQDSIVTLEASASTDVTPDAGRAILYVEKEAPTAGEAQNEANLTLAKALRYAKQPTLSVSTIGYQTFPVHAPKTGEIKGWRVRARMQIESKDMPALTETTSRLGQTLSIEDVSFYLSRDARLKVESGLTSDAIKAFQAKADQVARAFNRSGYHLKEVNVRQGDTYAPVPRPMMAKMMSMAAEAAPVPMEAGKTTVSITVQGSVTLD